MSSALLFPGMSGPWEVILVLLVILLLFGAKRLPELAKSLGKSLSEFKKGREEGTKPSGELKAGNEDGTGPTDKGQSVD